jgi:GNAT superfamily N-acetyltransferase
VDEAWRRRGVAHALTAERLGWIGERAREAYCIANLRNRPSLELHAAFGFVRLENGFTLPGLRCAGGEGGRLRVELSRI